MSSVGDKPAFKIHGMDCAEEIATLKHALGPLLAEERLSFDVLNGKMIVDRTGLQVSNAAIVEAVAKSGLKAVPWGDDSTDRSDMSWWDQHGRTVLTITCGLFGSGGLVAHAALAGGVFEAFESDGPVAFAHLPPLPAIAFYGVGILAGICQVIPKAWRAILSFRPDMNLLMTIAVVGAAAIGEWFEAATVSFLFSLSLLLESWSVGRARRAIAALMDLSPPTARIRDEDGRECEVTPEEVDVGQMFLVRPDERIPLDGRVVQGVSAVNQAPITGESASVAKSAGSEVFAGTINGEGALQIECTKPAADTTLAHIIRLVREASSRSSPSEKWVERFATVYTPLVMAMALFVLVVPPVLLGGEWLEWLYRALVLLVIACPCALVISTPVSVVAALASAAQNGVLIKGGVFVETPARLTAVALDKTGTLTAGRPEVVEIVPMNGHTEAELLERAAALESHSNHPLARAIVAVAQVRNVKYSPAEEFEIIPGKGATGRFDEHRFWLGSHRYLEERGQETPAVHDRLKSLSQSGRTVVVVGHEEHVCGFIALADTLRPGIPDVLRQLHELGIGRIVMLTGDNQGTASAVAAEAGVDEVHAELLPKDKVKEIESLVERYNHVAMVGDGVNDAPALARSGLGIAMGAAGSDAAIETADIALMSDDLSKLPWLVRHSRRTLAVIRQNIVLSLAVKAAFVVLTFAGFASLWAAIAADMGTSLLVIFNGLRLLAGKP